MQEDRDFNIKLWPFTALNFCFASLSTTYVDSYLLGLGCDLNRIALEVELWIFMPHTNKALSKTKKN